MKTIIPILCLICAACAGPAPTGTDTRTPEAQAWIQGAVAVRLINESFDRQLSAAIESNRNPL